MHPKGNTQLKTRKWWVPLRSALYIFLRPFKMPINNQHQVSNRENTKIDSSLLQKNNASYISSTNTKCQAKNSLDIFLCALQQ